MGAGCGGIWRRVWLLMCGRSHLCRATDDGLVVGEIGLQIGLLNVRAWSHE